MNGTPSPVERARARCRGDSRRGPALRATARGRAALTTRIWIPYSGFSLVTPGTYVSDDAPALPVRLDDRIPLRPRDPRREGQKRFPISLTSGPLLALCAHGDARFQLQTPGQRPGGPKAISYQ
jgi:hypothetical protein